MKLLIASGNPVKINGAKKAFEKYFDNVEIEGFNIKSEVSDEPFDKEILQGAKNRIKNLKKYAKENNLDADFYLASEEGITNLFGEKENENWINLNLVIVENKEGFQSIGTSQGFPIPDKYIEEIRQNELGNLMNRLFNGKDLKRKGGGIDILTKGKINRTDLIENAFTMALIEQINGNLWR